MSILQAGRDELRQAVDRTLHLVSETPDDRLFWKPSPTARSIGEIVAHCAGSLRNIASQMKGIPFPIPTSAEANVVFLAHDAEFRTREAVVEALQSECASYLEYLGTLSEGDLTKNVAMPFGLGMVPLAEFVMAGANHTQSHNSQIEYIQTLYGDHDWHTGF